MYFLLADGVCYHGHAVSGGKKSSSGPLALKRELRETQAQVADARKADRGPDLPASPSSSATYSASSEELEHLRGAQQNQEKEAARARSRAAQAGRRVRALGSRLSVARLELERLGREKTNAIARSAKQSQAAVAEKERTRSIRKSSLEAARGEIEGLQAQAARVGEEHAVLRAGLAGLEERRRAERTAVARVEAQINELTARGARSPRELERMGVERARLLADNIELDQRAGRAHRIPRSGRSRSGAPGRAGEQARARRSPRSTRALKVLRAGIQEAQENRSHIEVELVEAQADLKYLDETSRKELNIADRGARRRRRNRARRRRRGRSRDRATRRSARASKRWAR